MCELGLCAASTHIGEQKLTAQAVARTHSSGDTSATPSFRAPGALVRPAWAVPLTGYRLGEEAAPGMSLFPSPRSGSTLQGATT